MITAGTIINNIFILWKRNKLREVKKPTQGHTARERRSQESALVHLIPMAGLLPLDP